MRRFSFTKILGVILALALVVCIASGLVTRFSYTDTVAQTSRSGRAFLAFPKSGPSDDEIDMIMQSVLQAELIAPGKMPGKPARIFNDKGYATGFGGLPGKYRSGYND